MYKFDIMAKSLRTSEITSESRFFIYANSSFNSYKSGTSDNVYIRNFVVVIVWNDRNKKIILVYGWDFLRSLV